MLARSGPDAARRSAPWTWCIFVATFLIYNANGREIQSYDSQPTK